MKFSIGQAAKETGKSKSTISRAIKSGRLSAHKNGDTFEIDAAELFRVFPATDAQPVRSNDTHPQNATTATATQPDKEVQLLREMLERERATVDDLRGRLTRAELLLTDQRKTPKKWFWQR
jgi:excisionase family DNA binding protein